MTRNSNAPFRTGQEVTITSAPAELLKGLPSTDQESIKSCVGKLGIFVGTDQYGYAEIEFSNEPEDYRTIFVNVAVVKSFTPN